MHFLYSFHQTVALDKHLQVKDVHLSTAPWRYAKLFFVNAKLFPSNMFSLSMFELLIFRP